MNNNNGYFGVTNHFGINKVVKTLGYNDNNNIISDKSNCLQHHKHHEHHKLNIKKDDNHNINNKASITKHLKF